jgi:hypothetical protein
MKRIISIVVMIVALAGLQAQQQFVSFGDEFDLQHGDFAVGDIDNDGDLDIIFSGETSNDPCLEKGGILINDGSGKYTQQLGNRAIKMGRAGNIQFGDIDGDGDLDIIFGGWAATNISPRDRGIALNNGDGIYTLADDDKFPISMDNNMTSCGFVDFNLDGLLDYYFFAVKSYRIYTQKTDGTFQETTEATEAIARYYLIYPEVTVMDFDNDRYPDIFITAFDSTTLTRFSSLFKNNGFGVFKEFAGVNIYRKKANGSSSWGDFNGDGYLDLLLNGDGFMNSGENNDGVVRVYKNESGLSTSVACECSHYRQIGVGNGSAIVDWDNDGDLDYIVGGWNDETKKQEIALYVCNTPSRFGFTKNTEMTDNYFPGISEQGFRIADINGDNKVDLLVCGFSNGTLSFNRRISGYIINPSSKASVLPGVPTNLKVDVKENNDVTVLFSWDAPQSEANNYGTTYNLSLRNKTTGQWLYNPMAVVGGEKNGWRKIAGRMGNTYANKSWELYNLPQGIYEWTVQAINGAYLGGPFAQVQEFTVGNPTSAPDRQQRLNPNIYAADGKLFVKMNDSAQDIALRVIDVEGHTVIEQTINSDFEQPVPKGFYVVELKTAGQAYQTKVIVH